MQYTYTMTIHLKVYEYYMQPCEPEQASEKWVEKQMLSNPWWVGVSQLFETLLDTIVLDQSIHKHNFLWHMQTLFKWLPI